MSVPRLERNHPSGSEKGGGLCPPSPKAARPGHGEIRTAFVLDFFDAGASSFPSSRRFASAISRLQEMGVGRGARHPRMAASLLASPRTERLSRAHRFGAPMSSRQEGSSPLSGKSVDAHHEFFINRTCRARQTRRPSGSRFPCRSRGWLAGCRTDHRQPSLRCARRIRWWPQRRSPTRRTAP